MRISRHLRWRQLVTAFVISAVVGVGTYTATYRALLFISETPSAAGQVAPLPAHSPGPEHVVGTPLAHPAPSSSNP